MRDQNNTHNDQDVPPCLMVLFGASGDLTKRLLLPSIYNLVAAKVLPSGFRLLGVGRDDWRDQEFRDHVSSSLKEFWGADADSQSLNWIIERTTYQQADFGDDASFENFKTKIEQFDSGGEEAGANRLFYLAVAPNFIATIAGQLSRHKLLEENKGCWRRLVIEKPFGHDLDSARALNAELRKSMREDQIYRIDHFAGKDSVQDIAVFRFSNAIVEPIWNRSLIDNVQITAAETVGVEKRAGYYETSGAVRDMVPNHLAQLISLIAMEPPVSFTAEHLRDKQVELLASIHKLRAEDVGKYAVRGQYGAGTVKGSDVSAYRDEPGVSKASITETYVAMRVDIDNWRWAGVPFFLRTGKCMSNALTEIAVTFRQPPARLFPNARQSDKSPNQVVFNLKPSQSIRQTFAAKAPGLKTIVNRESTRFQFPDGPFGDHAKGYERLLHDVMVGDTILFQRADFVEEGWSMVAPLLEAWQTSPSEGFPNYAAGSSGPSAADALLAASGHSWQPLEEV